MEAALGANAKRPRVSPRPVANDHRSIAVGADAHAHSGSVQGDAATFLVALALDVAFARRRVNESYPRTLGAAIAAEAAADGLGCPTQGSRFCQWRGSLWASSRPR